jgi:hypothetical protein
MFPILTYDPLAEYRANLATCLKGVATGELSFCDSCNGEGRCYCKFCYPNNRPCPYCSGIGLRALPLAKPVEHPAFTTVMAIAAKRNDAYQMWRMNKSD